MLIPLWLVITGSVFAGAGYLLIGAIALVVCLEMRGGARYTSAIDFELGLTVVVLWPVMFPTFYAGVWWHERIVEKLSTDA